MNETRFWAKVSKSDGCWLWMGCLNTKGYGRIMTNGKQFLAHRVAYALSFGAIPNGLCVCHTCDVRACVRPEHLWLGTNSENIKDKCTKGRHWPTIGENSTQAKLKNKDIYKIMILHSEGETLREIAKKFAVTHRTIQLIVTGKRWKHLT